QFDCEAVRVAALVLARFLACHPLRSSPLASRALYRMREPMMPVNKLYMSGSGEHWRKGADAAISLADDMDDEISKQMMLQIADDYGRQIADDYERPANAPDSPSAQTNLIPKLRLPQWLGC